MIQPMAYCQDCRLSAVVDLKFGEYGTHMITDRTFRDVEFPRDISILKPFHGCLPFPMLGGAND